MVHGSWIMAPGWLGPCPGPGAAAAGGLGWGGGGGEAKVKLGDLHAALESCAKSENHNSLDHRLGYLENFLGESREKHIKELADHKEAALEHQTSMETRLEYIEGLLGVVIYGRPINKWGLIGPKIRQGVCCCFLVFPRCSWFFHVQYLKFIGISMGNYGKSSNILIIS